MATARRLAGGTQILSPEMSAIPGFQSTLQGPLETCAEIVIELQSVGFQTFFPSRTLKSIYFR